MSIDRIHQLREEYSDRYVMVKASRPALARFGDAVGRVKSINMNGRALVEFGRDGDRSWYDIELDHLKVVAAPQPVEASTPGKKNKKSRSVRSEEVSGGEIGKDDEDIEKLSLLELARLNKQREEAGPEDHENP